MERKQAIRNTVDILALAYTSMGLDVYSVTQRITEDLRHIFGGDIGVEGHVDCHRAEVGAVRLTKSGEEPGFYFLFGARDLMTTSIYVKYYADEYGFSVVETTLDSHACR